MSKCFPYKKISSQSIIKGQAVFHAHISLRYLDCSKIQNCEYGKERNMQTKCYSISRQSPELSMISSMPRMWDLLYLVCAVSPELKCETWPPPQRPTTPIFCIFQCVPRCTLTPAFLTTGVMEIGVNFYLFIYFLKCDVFTG